MLKVTLTERFKSVGTITQAKRKTLDFIKNNNFPVDGRRVISLDFEYKGQEYSLGLNVRYSKENFLMTGGSYDSESKKIVVNLQIPKDFFKNRSIYLNKIQNGIDRVLYHEFIHKAQFDQAKQDKFYGDHLTSGLPSGENFIFLRPVFRDEFYDEDNLKEFNYFSSGIEAPAFSKQIIRDAKTSKTSLFDMVKDYKAWIESKVVNRELTAKAVYSILEYMQKTYSYIFNKDKKLTVYLKNLKELIMNWNETRRNKPENVDKLRPIQPYKSEE
jgi:hypothetical protein